MNFPRAALITAAALILPAASATAAEALRIGKADVAASHTLPVNVAQKLGIFKKHGLDVAIADFTGGSKLVQAMTANSIDIGVAAGPLLALVAKGAPVLGVCNMAPPLAFIGIAVPWDSPIKKIEDLKGKKIGISSAGSLTDWLASELARQHGWGPDGVTEVTIGNAVASIVAAFRTHTIDADIPVTSDIFEMEEKQEARLLIPASDYVGNVAAGTIYATNRLIANDPAAIHEFIAAWMETVDFIRNNKAETVKIESEVTGFSEGVMSKEYDLTHGMFSRDCKFDAESMANLKRSFVDLKLVEPTIDMSTLYTEAFLPK